MSKIKDINKLRKEVEELNRSLTNLIFKTQREKSMLENAETNLRATYALVQSKEATLEEFNEYISLLDNLRLSISESEKAIEIGKKLLLEKEQELLPLEERERKQISKFIIISVIIFILGCFIVVKVVTYIFGITLLESFGWIFGILFLVSTIVSIGLVIISIFWSIKEKINRK